MKMFGIVIKSIIFIQFSLFSHTRSSANKYTVTELVTIFFIVIFHPYSVRIESFSFCEILSAYSFLFQEKVSLISTCGEIYFILFHLIIISDKCSIWCMYLYLLRSSDFSSLILYEISSLPSKFRVNDA